MKNMLKWLFALSCLVLAVCVAPMEAKATDANGDGYKDEEVAALAALIDGSSLSGSVDTEDPASWTFVGWVDGTEKVVEVLDLSYIQLNLPDGKLDLSPFPALYGLDCSYSDITAVDVTQNPQLGGLTLHGLSGITSLDVTQNPALWYLGLNETGITSLDLSQNPELYDLNARDCALTSLDVSNNPELCYLSLDETDITSLDVTKNPELVRLELMGPGSPPLT